MILLNLMIDTYERKARLYPALILMAPGVIAIVAITSTQLPAVNVALFGLVVECGGAFLLSQLARDAGKKKEKALFEKWGGMPSVAIFRHRDTRLDPITKAGYHKKLSTLVDGTKPPSVADEQSDPEAADHIYTAWSTYLRLNTRDAKKYRLLFLENISYGYRRNIWGMQLVGAITSVLFLAVTTIWLYVLFRAAHAISLELAGASLILLVFSLLWLFRFSPSWVRIAADAYAERLAEAANTL